jgi:hypothetical protein
LHPTRFTALSAAPAQSRFNNSFRAAWWAFCIQEPWLYDRRDVKDISYARRALTFLCLAVILSTALAHAGVNLLLAILVPIWFFLATVVIVPLPGIDERYDIEPSPVLPVLSPRPPPAR